MYNTGMPTKETSGAFFLSRLRSLMDSARAQILILLVISTVVYLNSIPGPFVMDDISSIVLNPALSNLSYFTDPDLRESLRDNFVVRYHTSSRLVTFLSFALNNAVHGAWAPGFHFLGILIHAGNALLLYALVLTVMRTPLMDGAAGGSIAGKMALFIAILFSVHPIQTQAVNYISERTTLLVASCYFGAIIFYLKARLSTEVRPRVINFALAALIVAIGMKTKETAFMLPPMLVLCELALFNGPLGRRLMYVLPYALLMPIVPLAFVSIDKFSPLSQGVRDVLSFTGAGGTPHADYVYTQMRVLLLYARLIVWPVGQNLDYDFRLSDGIAEPGVLGGMALVIAGIGSGFYFLARGQRDSGQRWWGFAGFGLLWFFLAMSLESGMVPLVDLVFEHRLYLPSAGLFMAALGIVAGWRGENTLAGQRALSAMAVLVVVLSIFTVARNHTWSSGVRLWEDAVAKSPGKARPHYNLAVEYETAGRPQDAAREYAIALKIKPGFFEARNNLGLLYAKAGRLDDASREFFAIIQNDPKNIKAHQNLGNAYLLQHRNEEAMREFQSVLMLDSNNADTHLKLGIVYFNLGRNEEAGREFSAAVTLDPDNPNAHFNLALYDAGRGRLEDALAGFRAVLRLNPMDREAMTKINELQKQLGLPLEGQ